MRFINTLKQLRHITDISIKNFIIMQCKCLICMIIFSITSLIFPSFISIIVDKGIAVNNLNKIVYYSILMLVVGIIMILFYYLQRMLFFKTAQSITIRIKEKVYSKLLKTNLKFWFNNKIGDIFTVMERDISQLEFLFTNAISQLFVNLFMVAGIYIYIVYIDVVIGISTIVLSLLFAIAQRKIGYKVQAAMAKMRSKIGEVTAFTNESLNNMNEIQVSGYSSVFKNKYTEKIVDLLNQSIHQTKLMSLSQIFGIVFNVIGVFIVIILGALKVYHGYFSVGVLFTLTIYVQRLYSPIVGLADSYIQFRNIIPIISKISEVLDTEDTIDDGTYLLDKNLKGDIEFKNIDFSYGEDQVLNQVSFEIKAGNIIGLVGENGCGKTTIIRLLTKLCLPQSGEILLDNKNLNDYNTGYLRTQIGCMFQNTFISSGKLRDIVNPSMKEISDSEIIKMMNVFQLKLDEFSHGLDTEIGENKTSISGGEAQKLALVRLFLEDKPILILDEPTASIDIKSEHAICKELKCLLQNKTAIVITHRTEILNICDSIINLQTQNTITKVV